MRILCLGPPSNNLPFKLMEIKVHQSWGLALISKVWILAQLSVMEMTQQLTEQEGEVAAQADSITFLLVLDKIILLISVWQTKVPHALVKILRICLSILHIRHWLILTFIHSKRIRTKVNGITMKIKHQERKLWCL